MIPDSVNRLFAARVPRDRDPRDPRTAAQRINDLARGAGDPQPQPPDDPGYPGDIDVPPRGGPDMRVRKPPTTGERFNALIDLYVDERRARRGY